jgi:hypothetical protein
MQGPADVTHATNFRAGPCTCKPVSDRRLAQQCKRQQFYVYSQSHFSKRHHHLAARKGLAQVSKPRVACSWHLKLTPGIAGCSVGGNLGLVLDGAGLAD